VGGKKNCREADALTRSKAGFPLLTCRTRTRRVFAYLSYGVRWISRGSVRLLAARTAKPMNHFLNSLRKSVLWIALLAALSAAAQTQAPPSKPAPTPSQTAVQPEPKISPKEAEDLFHDVDNILQFASKETGLPIKHEVQKQLTSRDQVVAYLEKTMSEDKDAQRLRRSELVLKKFGLLPHDFDLQKFLLTLLREQVAGYYDPKTQTVNLLDWIDADQQRPVMAHELTHALQDQSFDLEKWMKAGEIDLDNIPQPKPSDLNGDEISEARQAVVEGQAMVVLVDYMLEPTGQSILGSPQIADALKEGMLVGSADAPAFKDAPIFLKEVLTFPYRYGLDFETELLRAKGKEQAFAAVFANPPQTSRQIMEPATYLSGEHIDPVRLPNFQVDFKSYNRFDLGAMGEFDVALLVDQYAGVEASHEIYPHWRGGYYYAARPKGHANAPLALLYFSRWADDDAAREFAAIYAKALEQRYKNVHESPEDAQRSIPQLKTLRTLNGTHTWLTGEGPVVIVVQGDTTLITESLDQPTTDRLKQELLGTVPSSAKQ